MDAQRGVPVVWCLLQVDDHKLALVLHRLERDLAGRRYGAAAANHDAEVRVSPVREGFVERRSRKPFLRCEEVKKRSGEKEIRRKKKKKTTTTKKEETKKMEETKTTGRGDK